MSGQREASGTYAFRPNVLKSDVRTPVVGRRLGEAAGRQLKRVMLELGGNNPLVIYPATVLSDV